MLHRLPLQYRVFLWVSLAVAIPMAVLVGSAVQYARQTYAKEVDADMFAALNRTVSAVDRRLYIEHDLIRGLSKVPAVSALLPALQALHDEAPGVEPLAPIAQAAHFFETFQSVRRSLATVRVLDAAGDTLIKVRGGRALPAVFDALGTVPVIENGSEIPGFRNELSGLWADSVGSLTSPPGFEAFDAALNTTLPLSLDGEALGYLVIGPPLEPIDRTLDVGERPRGATLLIAEINPEDESRNGVILYADEPKTTFSTVETRARLDTVAPMLLVEGRSSLGTRLPDGHDGAWYFRQYSPYPDRLLTWLFAYHLKSETSATPFWHANILIWGVCLLSLGVGLMLANVAARQVTKPVALLAHRLTGYAQGARQDRLQPSGAPELREAHAAFNRMADELGRLEEEREQTQRAMVQNAKLTSIGQLAAGIAHELRNPLANIFSLTKLVQRDLPEDATGLRSDVEDIRSEAERASSIIHGLLDFARQGPAHADWFQLPEWLEESVALVTRMAESRRVTLEAPPAPDLRLHGDHRLLQQALVNILINALQATPEGGTVQVSARSDGDWVEVSVEDQGPGIPAGIADRLFDPFFTTKPEGEGSGLGLSIAIGIVERHGGRLTLANGPNGGARARILLPLGRNNASETAGQET